MRPIPLDPPVTSATLPESEQKLATPSGSPTWENSSLSMRTSFTPSAVPLTTFAVISSARRGNMDTELGAGTAADADGDVIRGHVVLELADTRRAMSES